MSFSTALSGLNAATADLNVKSNNIANVNTTGFKQSRAEFGDVFAVSAFGSSSKTAVGSGVTLQQVAQQFNQGNLEFTNNSLDLAISGQGFFALAPEVGSGEVFYTRAGEFGIDKDGYVVSNTGDFLRTFPVDASGNISATSMTAAKALQLPASSGEPEPTDLLTIAVNMPSNAEALYDPNTVVPAVAATRTADAVFTLADFSGTNLVFTVKGDLNTDTVTLNANYTAASITDVINDINAQLLTSGITVSQGTGADVGKLVYTDETAGVWTTPTVTHTSGGTANQVEGTTTTAGVDAILSELAINPFDPTTFTNSTSATIFDSLGNEHIITTYYQKIDPNVLVGGVPVGDNQWQMEVYISGEDIKIDPSIPTQTVTSGSTTMVELVPSTRVSFNPDGSLIPLPAPITFEFNPALGTELQSGASDNQIVTLSITGSTQNSGSFSVGALTINGFQTGRLTGVDVSSEGLIRATYSNGQAIPIGKIALARFANPQALGKIGNTQWEETTDSGPVIPGEPGTGSFGQIQAGALETSNVDLTKELVGLITAQRNFQANSKAIETNNAITQTIINLR